MAMANMQQHQTHAFSILQYCAGTANNAKGKLALALDRFNFKLQLLQLFGRGACSGCRYLNIPFDTLLLLVLLFRFGVVDLKLAT